jgi:cytidyltransferase-like protein
MSKINKILDLKSLRLIRNKFKKKKIVLCHGVFDLLHVGHINYFKAARSLGDTLVVSLTDDKYVNKGPGRPAFLINNRIKFLKEINCIDHIYVSTSDTAENVI